MEKENYKLYNGDCLEIMDRLIEKGVEIDAIICDPPYGTTACKWDTIIPFDKMWERLNKLIKPNGAICLFGSQPFTSALISSNFEMFKYEWVWIKSRTVGFLNAKNAPLKKHENILVFSKGKTSNGNKNNMIYNPQGLIEINKKKKSVNQGNNTIVGNRPSRNKEYICKYKGYPNSLLEFKNESKQVHPTQKPVDLLKYLIKTYTNKNEVVLDFTMGSGSTGVACMNTNRKFLVIELEVNYFNIAKQRIEEACK